MIRPARPNASAPPTNRTTRRGGERAEAHRHDRTDAAGPGRARAAGEPAVGGEVDHRHGDHDGGQVPDAHVLHRRGLRPEQQGEHAGEHDQRRRAQVAEGEPYAGQHERAHRRARQHTHRGAGQSYGSSPRTA